MRTQACSTAFLLGLLIAAPAGAHNQFEVSGAFGYRFGGTVKVDSEAPDGSPDGSGKLLFEGAPAFTGIVGYRSQPNGFAFLSYTRQQTRVGYDVADDGDNEADLYERISIENFQIGGNVEVTKGIFVPYLGASLGLARVASLDAGKSRFFFSPVLDGGVKVDVHDHVHLRALGRIPFVFANNNVVCAETAGCYETDTIRPFTQFELMIGAGASF